MAALSAVDEQARWFTVACTYAITVVSWLGVGMVVWRCWRGLPQPPAWAFVLVVSFTVYLSLIPRAWEYFHGAQETAQQGYPLEIELLLCLHGLAWSLLALGQWRRCLQNAAAASLFLMLGVSALAADAVRLGALAAYSVVGLVWMWVNHRDHWLTGMPYISKAINSRVVTIRKMPWGVLGVTLGGGALVFGIYWLVQDRVAGLDWIGWLASSGGSLQASWLARSGVGDGPDEVAGLNARSAGLVESDHMIEDCRDSLVDVISETYGEPLKPRDMYEKMLPGDEARIIQRRGHVAQNLTPNRDFTLKRKKRAEPTQSPQVRTARALFEIQGRTPLHIRRIVYDSYDEQSHTWRESRNVGVALLEPVGRYWLEVRRALQPGDWYAAEDYHTVKITNLKDNFVPAPPLLKGLQLRHASCPDYFYWKHDDVLALRDRSQWPSGVVLKTCVRTISYDAVPATAWMAEPSLVRASRYGQVPEVWRAPLHQLAQEWCQDLPAGWPQVQAILSRLRSAYQLDPDTVAPADHPEPIWWFLTESKRGPDYFFASSAVLLLRVLGYPTRLCLGYYAAPEAYDPQTGHTPVTQRDIHFWAELRLRDGHWAVIEPTPGYGILAPKSPWWSWGKAYVLRAWQTFLQTWHWWATCMLGLGLVWGLRRRLLDVALVCWWSLVARGGSWRGMVGNTWRILERRAKWAGIDRPAWQTPLSWLQDWQLAFESAWQQQAFVTYLARALYAPQAAPPASLAEIRSVCRTLLRLGTYSRWRTLGRIRRTSSQAYSPAANGRKSPDPCTTTCN